jgi:DNA-binding NarL/FixJ family response regulator
LAFAASAATKRLSVARASSSGVPAVADAIMSDITNGATTVKQPDIAVLDYSLPLINGIEATRQAHLPKTEVLIFTMHDNETLIQELMKAGARGYLLKSDASRDLIAAIEALAIHKPFPRSPKHC